MKLIETKNIDSLSAHDRACVKLARKARADTFFGGASALVLAKRCKYKNFPADEIVSDIYGASNGSLGEWERTNAQSADRFILGRKRRGNAVAKTKTKKTKLNIMNLIASYKFEGKPQRQLVTHDGRTFRRIELLLNDKWIEEKNRFKKLEKPLWQEQIHTGEFHIVSESHAAQLEDEYNKMIAS